MRFKMVPVLVLIVGWACGNAFALTCYVDNDNDGYGTTAFTSLDGDCTDPGEAAFPGDCNDSVPAIHPGAVEIVGDQIDEDCNAQEICYRDLDGDHYGSGTVVSVDIDCADAGEATVPNDCNDSNASIHPGAVEIIGNGVDEDCNGVESCYQDVDNDHFGRNVVINSGDLDCLDANESGVNTDCNDTSASIYPGAPEIIGNGVDENCDGGESCYQDNDHDSYGSNTVIASIDLDCTDVGEATNSTDCSDANASVYPGAIEICGDGIDNDCDTFIDEGCTRTITAWRSVRTHVGWGALSIVLDPAATGNGLSGPRVEPRQGGIRRIEVDFSGTISLLDPTAVAVTDSLTNYSPGVSVASSSTLVLAFTPALPDQECFTILLGSGLLNETISGDNDCNVRSLVADTTMSGDLNLSDALFTKTRLGQVAAAAPEHDVDLSGGSIDPGDIQAIKSGVTSPARRALCP